MRSVRQFRHLELAVQHPNDQAFGFPFRQPERDGALGLHAPPLTQEILAWDLAVQSDVGDEVALLTAPLVSRLAARTA